MKCPKSTNKAVNVVRFARKRRCAICGSVKTNLMALTSGSTTAQEQQLGTLNEGQTKKAVGRTEVVRWTGAEGDEVEGLLHYPLGWSEGDDAARLDADGILEARSPSQSPANSNDDDDNNATATSSPISDRDASAADTSSIANSNNAVLQQSMMFDREDESSFMLLDHSTASAPNGN